MAQGDPKFDIDYDQFLKEFEALSNKLAKFHHPDYLRNLDKPRLKAGLAAAQRIRDKLIPDCDALARYITVREQQRARNTHQEPVKLKPSGQLEFLDGQEEVAR